MSYLKMSPQPRGLSLDPAGINRSNVRASRPSPDLFKQVLEPGMRPRRDHLHRAIGHVLHVAAQSQSPGMAAKENPETNSLYIAIRYCPQCFLAALVLIFITHKARSASFHSTWC